MKVIYKVSTLIYIFIFLLNSSPTCLAADSGSGLMQPCQYKQIYQYYMEKAQGHLADNQPEAAIEAYKMALIAQPISEEAKEGIEYIKNTLQKKNLKETPKVQAKPQTKEKAVITAVRRRAISSALDTIEPSRERAAREPVITKPVRQPRRPTEQPIKQRSQQPEGQIPQTQRTTGDFYQNNFFLEAFSNGIDQSIQKGTESINNGIAPGKISGEYRTAVGVTTNDVIWKDANADHVSVPGEKNWRHIYGENPYNMYDKKIYDRFRVEAEGPITPHLSSYSEIVIDPWTFVGRKDVTVNGSGGSSVNMTLKYWSNVRRTINETYRAENSDIVNVQENKIIDGHTSAVAYRGLTDFGANTFSVPETEIDDMYVPVRKLWVDYDNGPYHIRLFPMADQDQALTSDDPLKLSNNKIWWEESPWLDEYEPSKVFTTGALKQGQWVRKLSFIARNSEYERLTFLRGVNIAANFDNGFSIESTLAAPRNLWDFYEEVSSVPGAVRVKFPPYNEIKLAGTYTTKMGIHKQDIEAINQVVGVDIEYLHSPDASVYGELALSFTDIDEANNRQRDFWGAGYTIGLKNKGTWKSFGDDYELNLSFAHMNDNFSPGLSNYRFTRRDSIYGKHIYFQPIRPENDDSKIGDGIDIDRVAFNANAKANFLNDDLKTSVDFRDVRTDSGDFIEDVIRTEAEYKILPKITTKGLFRYQFLPDTIKGYDPLINAKTSYSAFSDYFSDKDVWLQNTAIEAGKDPSIGTYSLGLKYDVSDILSLQGIYEITNDPLDTPRGLLNDVFVTTENSGGVLWDKIVPFLYNQRVFGLPPYDYYNIYKTRLTYHPIKSIKIEPSFVYNENMFATTLDDNVTNAGISAEYTSLNDKLTLGLAYYYTRTRDILTDTTTGQENIFGHHNLFLACDYKINPNQTLTVMFGEYTGYGRDYYEEYTSIGPLDTQHIIRAVYKGKF